MQRKNFKINQNIYGKDVLLLSISDFQEVAKIELFDGEISIESDDDLDIIFGEFVNYTISLCNEKF